MKLTKIVCDICKSEIDPSLPGSLELHFTMRPEKTPRSFDICTADSCRGEILRLFYRGMLVVDGVQIRDSRPKDPSP